MIISFECPKLLQLWSNSKLLTTILKVISSTTIPCAEVKDLTISLTIDSLTVRRHSHRLFAQSRRASKPSNWIILKSIGPNEILYMTKFVQNLISYKNYSSHFRVELSQTSVIKLKRLS
jgi:hypothetical protein